MSETTDDFDADVTGTVILPGGAENAGNKNGKEKKKGAISRFRAFLFNRGAEKTFQKENAAALPVNGEKAAKETRKLNEYLDAIETQLDKMDEQNKILLFHLSTVKENNEALLNQVTVLSKNNDLLFQQFQASKKREKLAKTVAVISSVLGIGFIIFRAIMWLLGKGF